MSRLIDADKLDIRDDNCGCAYDAKIIIKNAPTVDAVPVRHGCWFFTEYDYYDCSVCGESYYNGCDSTDEAKHSITNGDAYPYCPNCGAKMDKKVTV